MVILPCVKEAISHYRNIMFNSIKLIMKNYLIAAIAGLVLLCGCDSATMHPDATSQDIQYYNICLVLDGTDRLSKQNTVDMVSVAELIEMAQKISEEGLGTLYVTYVDSDCDNNSVCIYENNQVRPADLAPKKGYEMNSTYEKSKEDVVKSQHAYDCASKAALDDFARGCTAIVDAAYSDNVAMQKSGSDVNGAINKAVRLLQASEQKAMESHVILVSDGCDNVGKELRTPLPSNTKLYFVNGNVSKHQYKDIVSKEFVSLSQASKSIFNK